MSNLRPIPEYLMSTVEMFKYIYPTRIPTDEYYSVIKIMKDNDMTDRSIAEVIANLMGGNYEDYLYDVGHIMPNLKLTEIKVCPIIKKLVPYGLVSWLNEED